MSKNDIIKAFLTMSVVMFLIVIVLFINYLKYDKTDVIEEEPDTVEAVPDDSYFTDTTLSVTTGYNIKDLENLTVTCIDVESLNDASYTLVNAFTLGLQAFCNENNINEKFKATSKDITSGVNFNIVELHAVSDSYDLTLSYDLSTDFVNVTVN